MSNLQKLRQNQTSHVKKAHRNRKYHKCDSCEKLFSQAGSLKIHINRVCNRQKDHKCDTCGKAFSQAGNMKKHINSLHNA